MLFSVVAHSDGDKVIDLSTVESQDHVRVDFVDLVLVVTDNVIEASLRVDTRLHCDAVSMLRVVDLRVNKAQVVHLLLVTRSLDVSLLEGRLVE